MTHNPAILQGLQGSFRRVGVPSLTVYALDDEPGGIPQLVDEVAPRFQFICAQTHIIPRCSPDGQGKAQGVNPIYAYRFGRVHSIRVQLGPAHLAPTCVPDQPVKVDGAEWHLTRVLQPHHDHPGHPEKQDIVARFHYGARVEIAEVFSIVWPTQRRVRPQCRTEPGIKNVRVLYQRL